MFGHLSLCFGKQFDTKSWISYNTALPGNTMSMHLHHPSLSLNGRKRGKVKFRNAAEAARARDLDADWKKLKADWGVEAEQKRQRRAMKAEPLTYKLSAPPGRETQRIDSRDTGHAGAVCSKEIPKYTGTKILGIGTLHKSNAVPVFSDEEAIAIATMRRN
jgi:hypothetical protein